MSKAGASAQKKLGRPVKNEAKLRRAAALVLGTHMEKPVPFRVAVHRVNAECGEPISMTALHRYVEKLRENGDLHPKVPGHED